jgi:hypothetical protein
MDFKEMITWEEPLHQTPWEKADIVSCCDDEIVRKISETREKFARLWIQTVAGKREGGADFLDWLSSDECDFFYAPAAASPRFHGCWPGGLAEHSLAVHAALSDILTGDFYRYLGCTPSPDTVAIVALCHDLCKADSYKFACGDAGSGKLIFSYDDSLPYGHGEKSAFLVGRFIKLTDEEAMAIRWHMGLSFGDKDADKMFGDACREHPLVLALHEADTRAAYYMC